MNTENKKNTLPETLKFWLSHDAPPWVQFIKYGICGATATAVGIIIFYICAAWFWPCLKEDDFGRKILHLPIMDSALENVRALRSAYCNTVGFLLSNFVAYITNILLVFKPGRHVWYKEVLFFYVVSGVAFLVGTMGQTLLIYYFGLMTSLAFGANIIASFMINYAMRKFVVFKG